METGLRAQGSGLRAQGCLWHKESQLVYRRFCCLPSASLQMCFPQGSQASRRQGVPIVVQWKRARLASMKTRVRSLASLSKLRIPHCHELWCRSQTRLGSGIAGTVVQASSYSSNSTPSLGTCIYRKCGPKGQKRKIFPLKKIHCFFSYYLISKAFYIF